MEKKSLINKSQQEIPGQTELEDSMDIPGTGRGHGVVEKQKCQCILKFSF